MVPEVKFREFYPYIKTRQKTRPGISCRGWAGAVMLQYCNKKKRMTYKPAYRQTYMWMDTPSNPQLKTEIAKANILY